MQGAIEVLLSGLLFRGLGPVVSGILMAAPLKKVARAQLKKIYVLDERGEMAGEYTLDSDCPIDYNDFLKVLPNEGIGDRDSLFVGEYVFTAFQSGKYVFVLLSRGQLGAEDVDWTALLLTATESTLVRGPARPAPTRGAGTKAESETGFAHREARARCQGCHVGPREGANGKRHTSRGGRKDPTRNRGPRRRFESAVHIDRQGAPGIVPPPRGGSIGRGPEGDGGRESGGCPRAEDPSTPANRAAGP